MDMEDNLIAAVRKKIGKTQKQVAYEVGIAERSYQDIERNRADIKLVKGKTLEGLSKSLGIPIGTLLAEGQKPHGMSKSMGELDHDGVIKWTIDESE